MHLVHRQQVHIPLAGHVEAVALGAHRPVLLPGQGPRRTGGSKKHISSMGSLLGLEPGAAGARLRHHGHGEAHRPLHLLLEDAAPPAPAPRGALHDEFVVDLEDELALQALPSQAVA